jgi:hypothetical protein
MLGAYPQSGAIEQASLAYKCQNMVEVTERDKHTNVLQYTIYHFNKKLKNTYNSIFQCFKTLKPSSFSLMHRQKQPGACTIKLFMVVIVAVS